MAGEANVNKKRGISGENAAKKKKGKDVGVEERIHGRASLRSRSLLKKTKAAKATPVVGGGRAAGRDSEQASERVRVRQTARREAGAKDKT